MLLNSERLEIIPSTQVNPAISICNNFSLGAGDEKLITQIVHWNKKCIDYSAALTRFFEVATKAL